MTPLQVLTISALGGLAALIGLILYIAAGLGVYAALTRIAAAHAAYRERRQILADHRRALAALPTTAHPKEHPRHD